MLLLLDYVPFLALGKSRCTKPWLIILEKEKLVWKWTNMEQNVLKWATSWQNKQNDLCAQQNSDQPGHPPSLIFTVLAVRSMGSKGPCRQRRLWSDWADAQADLSLCWAHMPFCWFCHEAAHFIIYQWILRGNKCSLLSIIPYVGIVTITDFY